MREKLLVWGMKSWEWVWEWVWEWEEDIVWTRRGARGCRVSAVFVPVCGIALTEEPSKTLNVVL